MRIILDTNILVSAFFSGTSTAAKVLDIAFMEHTVLASSETYAELEDVIWREKLDDYITRDERERLLNRFLKDVWLIKTKETITVCRDPKDNMILELAASGQADFIITGDKDLPVLNPFRSIRILTPAEFLKSVL